MIKVCEDENEDFHQDDQKITLLKDMLEQIRTLELQCELTAANPHSSEIIQQEINLDKKFLEQKQMKDNHFKGIKLYLVELLQIEDVEKMMKHLTALKNYVKILNSE